jgi:CMP-N-acetylneuraminic acid synthetase
VYLNKRIIGIIIARENSKRLKKKNIKKLWGKPLLAHTIIAAKNSIYLDKVIISTESKNIVKIAKKYKCEAPFIRPKKLSLDYVSATDVFFHALKKIKEYFDYAVLLQPTSPLRTAEDIDQSIVKIINENGDSLISVYYTKKINKFAVRVKNNKIYKLKNKNYKGKIYYLNGAIFMCNVLYFMKNKNFYSNKTIPYFMKKKYSVDIDYQKDFNNLINFFKS